MTEKPIPKIPNTTVGITSRIRAGQGWPVAIAPRQLAWAPRQTARPIDRIVPVTHRVTGRATAR